MVTSIGLFNPRFNRGSHPKNDRRSSKNDFRVNNNSQQEKEPEVRINPATKRHFELEIETLQNASRDEGKRAFKIKGKGE
jgi:hypothetical protein